jgi:uncharacterized Zn finger protein (UPF0148 family)
MTLVTPDDGKGCCPTCGQPTSLKVISAEARSALDAAVAAERAAIRAIASRDQYAEWEPEYALAKRVCSRIVTSIDERGGPND